MKLTAFEKEIMNTIWELTEPVTVRDVVNAAYPNGEKAYTTVQTIMNLLVEKGTLKRKKIGNVNTYTVVLARKKFKKKEVDNVLENLFNGSALNLISFLIGSQKLSDREIADLEKLIDEKKRNK